MYAIILAAGASTRFASSGAALGIPHAHKALADLGDGEALVVRCARLAREAGLQPVVVAGAAPERVLAAAAGCANMVVNARWRMGRTSTIQAGLAACKGSGPALIWPVDVPCLTVDDVARIVAGTTSHAVAIASDGRRGGHPVALAERARLLVLSASTSASFRDILRNVIGDLGYVSLESSGCTINVDNFDELMTARAWLTNARNTQANRPQNP